MGEGERPPEESGNSSPKKPPERPPRDGFLAERQIQEALQRGLFEDLPGKGQPLRIDPRQNTPEGLVAGLLKEANVVPEWIEIARALDQAAEVRRSDLKAARAAFDRLREGVTAALASGAGAEPEGQRRWPWSRRASRPGANHRERVPTAVRRLLSEGEEERRRAFAQYFRRAGEEVARGRRFNQVVPFANRQRLLLDLDETAGAFADAWPALRLVEREGEWSVVGEAVEPPRPPLEPCREEQEAARLRRDPARLAALRGLTRGRRPPPI